MKQVQFTYENPKHFRDVLQRIARFRGGKPLKFLFHVVSGQSDLTALNDACAALEEYFPDSVCIGSSSAGNIVSGKLSRKSVSVSCTLFERDTTRVGLLQYALDEEFAASSIENLVHEVEKRPWVTAVEILAASATFSYTKLCERLTNLRRDVQVFGGLARFVGEEIPAFVFSNRYGFSDEAMVCVLYGGEDFYVETAKVSGWKPLGKSFPVTKAEGNVLWELDGKPAFEAYSKYLNIQNDYYFFENTLEFPLFYHENGENLFRSPLACSEDGALLLQTDIEKGASVRIAYGDPQAMMDSVKFEVNRLSKFCPEAIIAYSDLSRKTYWGEADVNKETLPLNTLAPTFGFYASGELLRIGKSANLHNSVMAIVAMREGPANPARLKNAEVLEEASAGRVSVISRLANFTNVSSAELLEMYTKMTKNSITDALTGLYNRGEIQRRITERLAECPGESMSLVMMDIDNFKSVNDTYGHKEGDNVIVGLSNQIQMTTFENAPDADAGRWGGEEFMVMLPDMGIKEAVEFAEAVRSGFAQINFPAVGKKTISVGVTELNSEDTVNSICVRVDEALYEAKRTGKNKVVVA